MSKKMWASLFGAVLAVSSASISSATTWQKVGESASFTEDTAQFTDLNRLRKSNMLIDPAGNVYVSMHNNERGAIVIWRTDGTKLEIDLESKGFRGPVTRMLIAGDGLVYAAQNWGEINWMFARDWPNRILQIHPNGDVFSIYCPDRNNDGNCDIGDRDRIMDIEVNPDDGNLYWVMDATESSYWRYHFFWRYNVAEQVVEESPTAPQNEGQLDNLRMRSLYYVGDGNFATVWRTYNQPGVDVKVMKWERVREPRTRTVAVNGRRVTGFRNWITDGAYDHVNRAIWVGARGESNSNVTIKINGATTGASFFEPWPETGEIPGIQGYNAWHTNGNAADSSGVANGGQYWHNTIAINPADGSAWMSYGHQATYTGKDSGHVMVRGKEVWDYYDQGKPEEGAWVMALGFHGGKAYAAVCNQITGQWSLYSTTDTAPNVPTLSAGKLKDSVALGIQVKTDDTVATLSYPNSYGFLYIEQEDRSSAIRIEPQDTSLFVNAGDRISFQGALTLRNKAEAVLAGATVQGQESGSPIQPLYMNTKVLGGSKQGFQPAVFPGVGLNNVGMLVTVVGKLTEYDADATGLFFRVDDGSVLYPMGASMATGVKVRGIPMTAAVGSAWVKATGVVTVETETVGSTATLVPVILLPDGEFGEQVAP